MALDSSIGSGGSNPGSHPPEDWDRLTGGGRSGQHCHSGRCRRYRRLRVSHDLCGIRSRQYVHALKCVEYACYGLRELFEVLVVAGLQCLTTAMRTQNQTAHPMTERFACNRTSARVVQAGVRLIQLLLQLPQEPRNVRIHFQFCNFLS